MVDRGLFYFYPLFCPIYLELEHLTPDQLAEKLSVQKSWIYNQTRETGPGSLPRLKVGKYLRFDESRVTEWLQKQNARD
jgi:excisionase family DNA binding protein